jgi:hypothetical protein
MLVAANNGWWTEIMSWTVPGVTVHAPSDATWFRGQPVSGNVASLASDDGNELVARAGLVISPAEPPAQLETTFTAPSSVVFGIEVSLRARVNTPGLAQRVEIWNNATGQWDVLGQQTATTLESLQTVSVPGSAAPYVEPGTDRVKVKFVWLRTGLTLLYPWTVSVDQAQVAINGA